MKKKILLVEDDPFLIEIYSDKLRVEGFETKVVADGEKVLPTLLEDKFDLLVLDIVLPGKSGWEVLREINELRERKENLRELKILVLSNLSQKKDVDKAYSLGAKKYLIKAHFTPKEVIQEIKKILL